MREPDSPAPMPRPTPEDIVALNHEALAALDAGRPAEALATAIRALDLGGDGETRQLFLQAVRRVPAGQPEVRRRLAQALREGWGRPQALASVALPQLRAAWPNTARAVVTDELLGELLSSAPVADAEMERRLTAVRKGVMLARGPGLVPFLARLAAQCHLNEYAWAYDEQEAGVVEDLVRAVRAGTAAAHDVLALACYRALDELDDSAALLDRDWPDEVKRVLHDQIDMVRRAHAAAAAVRVLTPVQAPVSVAVRTQYEQNPYPRWTRFSSPVPLSIEALLAAQFPQAARDPIPNAEAPDVLVAGCGTGAESALVARRLCGAHVLGVDLSRASLGYAAAKSAEAGIANVDYAQADILALEGQDFDVVLASGVLHHMADPLQGARVLAGLLRPGGVIRIGLYSALARRILAPAKALARAYPPTAEGIRGLRGAVLRAAPGDPVRAVLGMGDFYTVSSCRDLLMHVEEHELTLADVRRMLNETGLRLLGFALDADRLAAYRRETPGDPAGADLEAWAAFEARHPETFIGMYEFWAQKPASTRPG